MAVRLYVLHGFVGPSTVSEPNFGQTTAACSFVFVFGLIRFTADHKLSASCVKSSCLFRNEENLCLFDAVCYLFLFTCLHNGFMHVDMYIEFMSTAPLRGSRLLHTCVEKESVACAD